MAAPKGLARERRATSGQVRHLTIAEFAARMGVAVQTVYGWNSEGIAPPRIKVGKHVCYSEAAVEAWEKARTIDGPDAIHTPAAS